MFDVCPDWVAQVARAADHDGVGVALGSPTTNRECNVLGIVRLHPGLQLGSVEAPQAKSRPCCCPDRCHNVAPVGRGQEEFRFAIQSTWELVQVELVSARIEPTVRIGYLHLVERGHPLHVKVVLGPLHVLQAERPCHFLVAGAVANSVGTRAAAIADAQPTLALGSAIGVTRCDGARATCESVARLLVSHRWAPAVIGPMCGIRRHG
mmetsp:Transcript_86379/g.239538  ORF Transcript_86379/g.239538 Transcript_86379/m.239538 type:complete len:208 (-) Transcript_86379:279-902(-)